MDPLAKQTENGELALEIAIKKHLAQTKLPSFDEYLLNKILARLEYEQTLKTLKPKLWTAGATLLFGLLLLVLAGANSWQAFSQTPTLRFVSLFFTDTKAVLANWQDYTFSVLESLPLGAIALFLLSTLAALVLFSFSLTQLTKFRKLNNHPN